MAQHLLSINHAVGGKMDCIQEWIQTFHLDESGATATELIILLVLIACFVISTVKLYGETVSEKYGWADERVAKFVTF